MTNQRGSMFGISLDTLNAWANVIYLVSVAIAAAASIALYQLSARISAQKDRDLAEFRIQAQRDIESARAEAGTANERAAKLENEAAQARLELEREQQERLKLQNALAWRRITVAQHDTLVGELRGRVSRVNLESVMNDPEATLYAEDIARTLKDAGVVVNQASAMFTGPVHGILLGQGSTSEHSSLAWVFSKAGIRFSAAPKSDVPRIIVGSKPPPF